MNATGRLEKLAPDQRAALFQALQQQAQAAQGDVLSGVDRAGPIPASFAQERLWILQQFQPGAQAYHIPLTIRLAGTLDVTALRAAIARLAARHESLRTTFAAHDGRVLQIIGERARVDVEHVTLPATAESEADAVRIAGERAARPFDLATGPLFRTCLISLSSRDHLLSMTFHHAIFDGWSIGVAVRDLGALYASELSGTPPALPPLPVQYADYAAWQRARVSGAQLDDLIAYWRQELTGAPGLLTLPWDRPRPEVFSYRGDAVHVSVPADVTARIQALARAERTTPFAVVLAAFAVLLGRYSHQEEVVIGTPAAGRMRREWEPVIGMFVNTLPLRLRPRLDASFRAVLAAASRTTVDAHARQELPLDVLIDRLRVPRTSSHAPLFQSMLVWHTAAADPVSLPGLDLRPAPRVTVKSAQVDLTLAVRERRDGGLSATFDYSTDLFDDETVRRMSDVWLRLLAAMSAAPDGPIGAVPLADASDLVALQTWNRTDRRDEPAVDLHTWFERQADATPDAEAVIGDDDGARLTYADVNARANRLARYLRRRGVGPDDLVGVILPRGIDMLVTLYAVLKAGGAYVPLDPSCPDARLRTMLSDAAPRLVIASSEMRSRLQGDVPVLVLDDAAEAIAAEGAGNLDHATSADNLAYMIYTSGSTGQPKGVMIPHRGIVNRLRWMQDAYGLGPGDRVLQKTPATFDVSVWELFWPLLTGAAVVLATPNGHKDPSYLAGLIARERVTVLHFVPSMLDQFLREPRIEWGSVRLLVASGEALRPDLRDRALAASTAEVENLYGPTEASVDVTCWSCRRQPRDGRTVPIGRPIANTRLYVLDQAGQPVPPDVPGEIAIAGVGLARGYHRRPALTAERFVPDPFADQPGSRLYRSGDLGRFRRDGAIEYIDRTDAQIKLHGFRVELGDIEAALARSPLVRACAVALRGEAHDVALVAYIVPAVSADPAGDLAGPLREHLRAWLPQYMVPAQWVLVEALPYTTSGKLDRRALPAPDGARPGLDVAYVEPRTPVERTLAEIWAAVLRVDRVGIEDNFFELGGDSMKVLQVVSRARERGLELATHAMYERQTIAAHASLFDAAADEDLLALVEGLGEQESAELLQAASSSDGVPAGSA